MSAARSRSRGRCACVGGALALLAGAMGVPPVAAQGVARVLPERAPAALISIIIDDIGERWAHGVRAIELPGPLAFAVLPLTRHAARLAELAQARGKEVLLHLPMESLDRRPLGPAGLHYGMSKRRLVATFETGLAAVPHVVGVNNHMGSFLTAQLEPMRVLMAAFARHPGLFFVDSRTTADTVAPAVADALGIPNTERDVFLDNEQDRAKILLQFQSLVAKARATGAALAIGHPHPATTAVLRDVLPRLASFGVRLVPVTTLLPRKNRRFAGWRPAAPGVLPAKLSSVQSPAPKLEANP